MMTDDSASVIVAFHPVADLDADLALVRRDEQQNAVVALGLAELPGTEQPVGERLDVGVLQRRHRGDDKLDRGSLLEIGKLGFERRARRGRQHIRAIVHAAGERRAT